MTLNASQISNIFKRISLVVAGMPEPMCTYLSRVYNKNPFIILIACLLSLRARDVVVLPIVLKLIKRVHTPQDLLDIPIQELERLLYPIGFYHKKAHTLRAVAYELIHRYAGHVPSEEVDLLSLPGVGRKTANLVRAEAFDIPAIAVDTHVHRLANELGLVSTKTPEATEKALQDIVPKNKWRLVNRLLVTCGQNRCDLSGVKEMVRHYGSST